MNEPAVGDAADRRPIDCLLGCLLGTAVGDAVGLPVEGLSRRRQKRLFPKLQAPCLVGRYGMVSDDTEHTCMVACALLTGTPQGFSRSFAHHLRSWLLTIPAGIGSATSRAILKLWVGYSPERSGIHSAGNAPAMRSAILGAYFSDSPCRLREYVHATTVITHTDPKAECGAMAVALAASHAVNSQDGKINGSAYLSDLVSALGKDDAGLTDLMSQCIASVQAGQITTGFARYLGLSTGVSGYTHHTVPVALHAALRHAPDLRAGVLAAVDCGGDTDSVAAIVGGIIGAGTGPGTIPREWLEHLWLWPLSVEWMEHLCTALHNRKAGTAASRCPRYPFLRSVPRNLLFLCIVLLHGFRRLLPPY